MLYWTVLWRDRPVWSLVTLLDAQSRCWPRRDRGLASRNHILDTAFNFGERNLCKWASYQIRKILGCACAGKTRNVFPCRRIQSKPLVSDPGMHHGTCRDACRDRLPALVGKTFPAFPAHAHPQLYVSGKRPMAGCLISDRVGSRPSDNITWWRHSVEAFSALLALCEGNPSIISGFQRTRGGGY